MNIASSLPLSALDTEPDLQAGELQEVTAAPAVTSEAALAPDGGAHDADTADIAAIGETAEAAQVVPERAVLPFSFDDEEEDDMAEPFDLAGGEALDFDADPEDLDEDREAATESEDGPDGEAKAEAKKKRSRRSRSRRKNGRTAAADAAGSAGEEDDEAPEAAAPAVEERRPERPERAERSERRPAAAAHPPHEDRREREERRPSAASHAAHEDRRFVPAPAPMARTARSSESYVIPSDMETLGREIIISVPERSRSMADERKIAVFCDLENIALGVRDSDISKFDINLILERLLEKGKIIVKKAYAD
ncbi:MAG TPA: hypothetical protein VL025_10555, partial [Thermoanaerobaculia bacterium]|nr:hypothetical protein [Thermoanaerobaculia bacterium]